MLFTLGAKKRGLAVQLLLTSIIFSMSANSFGDSGDTGQAMTDVQCVIPSQHVETEYQAIFRIHKLGVAAIPCLIRRIDSPDKIYLMLTNPVISTLLPGESQLQYA